MQSDIAQLSSIQSALDDLCERLVATADRYRDTQRADVAAALDDVERNLVSASRRLERLQREL